MEKVKFMFLTLLAVVVCGGFVSCSSDDDETYDSKDFVGVWYYDEECHDKDCIQEGYDENHFHRSIFAIESDGTFADYSSEEEYFDNIKDDIGTWTVANNIFITYTDYNLSGDSETDNWKIIEMSNNTIKLKFLNCTQNYEHKAEEIWILHRYNKK